MRDINIELRNLTIAEQLKNFNGQIESSTENKNELINEYVSVYNEWEDVVKEITELRDKFDKSKEIIDSYKNQRLNYAASNKAEYGNENLRKTFVRDISQWNASMQAVYGNFRDCLIIGMRCLITKEKVLRKKMEVLKVIIDAR